MPGKKSRKSKTDGAAAAEHSKTIMITDQMGVVMRCPTMEELGAWHDSGSTVGPAVDLFTSCIEAVVDRDKSYPTKDFPPEDVVGFVHNLSEAQFTSAFLRFSEELCRATQYGGSCSFVDDVKQGIVTIGMSLVGVIAAWGRPAAASEDISRDKEVRRLFFAETLGPRGGVRYLREVTLVNGRVEKIKRSPGGEFDVVLVDVGTDVGKVRQALRDCVGVGVIDAFLLVRELPKSIRRGMPKQEADRLLAALEKAGAVAQLWLRA